MYQIFLDFNFLSIGKLDGETYTNVFGGEWRLIKISLVAAMDTTKYQQKLCLCKANITKDNSIKLWYQQLSHASENNRKVLQG